MKRLFYLIKPFISIIFGALLLLYFLNYLQMQDQTLAIGVIAVSIACYYLASGILTILLGDKIPFGLKKFFEVCAIAAFPLFIFVEFILLTSQVYQVLGPNGWFITIITMVAAISLAGLYVLSQFVNDKLVGRIAFLAGAVFILALLLNVLFLLDGTPTQLGDLDLVSVVIYGLYTWILLSSFKQQQP